MPPLCFTLLRPMLCQVFPARARCKAGERGRVWSFRLRRDACLAVLLSFLRLSLPLPLPLPLAGCEPIVKMSLLSSDSLLLSLPEPLPSLSLLSCMEIACPRGLAAVAALR